MRKSLPTLHTWLTALSDAINSAQAGSPPATKPNFGDCPKALQASSDTADEAANTDADAGTAYEDLENLLPGGDNSLSQVVSSCRAALNAVSANLAPVNAVEAFDTILQEKLAIIDKDTSAKADNFMAFVKRLMFQVLSEVNIVSISPVVVFDVAHIGPAGSGPYTGTRYGAGPGIRFTVANTMMFTAAYAWNANRHVGEVPGAFYFALTTRNIFR